MNERHRERERERTTLNGSKEPSVTQSGVAVVCVRERKVRELREKC